MKIGQMMILCNKSEFLGLLIFSILILNIQCKSLELQSHWADQEIVIDGKNTEWQNRLTYFEKENIFLSIANDDSFLYLCFSTLNRELVRQISGRGLIVWFNLKNGDHEKWGIRYPMGMMPGDEFEGMGRMRRDASTDSLRQSIMADMFNHAPSEMELLSDVKEGGTRIGIHEIQGLEIRTSLVDGLMTYELKVAIAGNEANLYSANRNQENEIQIRFEIPEINREEMKEQMASVRGSSMRGGGGRGGGGGKRGRGGTRGQRPQRPTVSTKLKKEIVVQLAETPDTIINF